MLHAVAVAVAAACVVALAFAALTSKGCSVSSCALWRDLPRCGCVGCDRLSRTWHGRRAGVWGSFGFRGGAAGPWLV